MEEPRNKNGLTLAEFLASYDPDRYKHPSVTVDMVVFTLIEREKGNPASLALATLLIRRGDHPHIGSFALPGGFLDMDEPACCAAARELSEETGVTGLTFRQCGAFSAVNRDPRTRVITVAHYALAPFNSIRPAAGDDAAYAGLFTLEADILAGCASAEAYRVSLHGENGEQLCCYARLCYDELGALPQPAPSPNGEESQLAGDHAHVLFSAMCALNTLPRKRAARLLAGGKQALEPAALRALDFALGALPRRM